MENYVEISLSDLKNSKYRQNRSAEMDDLLKVFDKQILSVLARASEESRKRQVSLFQRLQQWFRLKHKPLLATSKPVKVCVLQNHRNLSS